jgi:membrane protein DedA with SNARE-associated domain
MPVSWHVSLHLHHLIARYGYAVVALFVGAESVGVPLPGETVLLTAAAFAGRGHLSIAGVIISSIAGIICGGSGGYWIGRTAGQTVILRYGRWAGITPERLDHTRDFFARYGARAVMAGRFIPIVRILASVVAGISNMPFARFSLYNAIAGTIWSVLFGLLGFEFARDLPRLKNRVGQAGLIALIVCGVALGGFLTWRHFRRVKPAGPSVEKPL